MKSLLLGFVLVLSTAVHAQSTSERLSDVYTNTSGSPSPTPALVETLSTNKETKKSKFGANVIFQHWANVGELKDNGSNALTDSENGIGLTYEASENWKLELRHGFELRTAGDKTKIKGIHDQQEGFYKSIDPTVHANYASSWSLFGSKPLTIANRYYVPVSQDSRDQTSLGVLRSQTSIDWELNPRWTVSGVLQGRLYMYRGNTMKDGTGSDSILYVQSGASATYNFNDQLNAYYLPYLLTQGTGFQRGRLAADKMNSWWNEIGINYTWGPVTINPAYATFASALNQNGYGGFGTDGNSEYDLNVIASF